MTPRTGAAPPGSVATRVEPEPLGFWSRLRYLAVRAWRMEVGVWQSLYRFVFRRPRMPEGYSAFPYHQPVVVIYVAFIVVSAVEVVGVDLLLHRWWYWRIPLLIVGIWGVTWMIGALMGFLTRPHAVGQSGILVRSGTDVDLDVPLDVMYSVRRVQHVADHNRYTEVLDTEDGRVLSLWIQQSTNLEIVLDNWVSA